MGLKRGTCKLCGRLSSLHVSHIIPSGIYKRIDEKIIHVDGNSMRARYSTDELREHLFCTSCELIFKKGEDVFYKHADSPEPILEELIASNNFRSNMVSEKDGNTLGIFILGILFRFHLCDKSELDLGSYSDKIKNLLLDDTNKQIDGSMAVCMFRVLNGKGKIIMPPVRRMMGEINVYCLVLLQYECIIALDQRAIDDKLFELRMDGNNPHIIFLSEEESFYLKTLATDFVNVQKVGKFAKTKT